jgi:hypothetical protein
LRFSSRSKLSIALSLFALAAIVAGLFATGALRGTATHAASASNPGLKHVTYGCDQYHSPLDCTEISEVYKPWPYYVGHDEPSNLFYSNVPGSGNQMQYELTLPKDPQGTKEVKGKSWNFQLHPAFWFGMAMCDTQSFPEQLSTCTPDSDKNIVDPAISPKHPGVAFMEMQFYPPGWVEWPAGNSCDPTKWCAALNIDSYSANPVTGQSLNSTCQGMIVGGVEYINFAFITLNGKPQPNSPPNPLHATQDTFTPNPQYDLFMNSGDDVIVKLHDTSNGLEIDLNDQTSGQSGSMTTSAANGFGQIKFAPNGTSCTEINYNFHPMYSTSSEKTRVTWAAHTYNIAFADEIGHFDYCNGSNAISPGGNCPTGNTEGIINDQEPTDSDDTACFPASSSSLVQVSGCIGTNVPGFDGVSYQPLWPDGSALRPTPIRFTSPLTGPNYNINYSRTAFESDMPRIEIETGQCNRDTGQGCTIVPVDDDGHPAAFYPFYSITQFRQDCVWQIGNHIPGSKNDFNQYNQYGQLIIVTYTGVGGAPVSHFEDYRQILSQNYCPSNN